MLSAAQSAFVNQMVNYVLQRAPGIDKNTLIFTGATGIRQVFSAEETSIVVDGYMHGLRVVFALCIAATGVATLVATGHRWNKLNGASAAAAV